MGQQQLHLIVLGIIIVGLAVITGLGNFQNNAVQSNRDAVIMDLNHLASFSQAYFKKVKGYGGRGHSFIGYAIPTQLENNDNGTYDIISTLPQKVIIQGTGVEKEGELGCSQGNNIIYQIVVEQNQANLQRIN